MLIDSAGVIVPVKFIDVWCSGVYDPYIDLLSEPVPHSHEVSLLLNMVLDQSAGVSWGHVLGWVGVLDTGRREQMVESEGDREKTQRSE